MSHQLIGAFKMAAQRVEVRGIVTNAEASTLAELKEFPREIRSPYNWAIHAFGSRNRVRDVPHQKIVVIDGMLAFKGSANLTMTGWRSVEKNLDLLEVVTNLDEVAELNNRYFSPVWGRCSNFGDEVLLVREIPF